MIQLKTGKFSSFTIHIPTVYKIETQQNARTMIILIFPLMPKSPSQKNAAINVISSFWKRYFGLFFEKYAKKKDGVIRGYDVRSTPVKIACILIMILCLAIVIFCLFPILWLFLASFKDIKEFNRNITIFPSVFDFSRIAETWHLFDFMRYYKNFCNISKTK